MRKFLCLLALVLSSCFIASAQDTLKVVYGVVDANVEGSVVIDQTEQTKASFERYIASRSGKKNYGYKILVYSSNAKEARANSSGIAGSLKSKYPQLNVYRSFKTPFFMVHVGDFRTKADAMKVLHELSSTYKQAKVIKSTIDWYVF